MLQPSNPAKMKEDATVYVDKATILIHSQGPRQEFMNMLKAPDPVKAVSGATVIVMQRLDTAMREAGVELDDVVKVVCARYIVSEFVELAAAAKLFNMDTDHAGLALSMAVQNYIKAEAAAGRINMKQLQVQVQIEMRQMDPKTRKEVMAGMAKVQQTGRAYKGGLPQQAPPATALTLTGGQDA